MTNHTRPGVSGGAIAALSIVPAAIAFGISFGVLAQSVGMGALAPAIMSATTFGGSAQFAAVSVLAGGGNALGAVATALVLNARYAPMGLAIAPAIEGPAVKRFFVAQLMVDESWALSRVRDRFDGARLIGAGLVLYVAWTGATIIGAAGGRLLGDPRELGMDAAFLALFLALLAPQLTSRAAWGAALIGAAVAAALVPIAPPGVPVIASTVGVVAGLWNKEEESGSTDLAPGEVVR